MRALQKHWLAVGLLNFYLIGLYLFLGFWYISYIIYIKICLILYYLTLFYIRKKGASRWSAHYTWSLKHVVRSSVNQDSTARPSPLIGRILYPVSQVWQARILQMTSGHSHHRTSIQQTWGKPKNTSNSECKSFRIYLVYLMPSI